MSQTNLNVVSPETTPAPRKGFGLLPCPLCGQPEVIVRLDLDDLKSCTCGECEESFDLDDVREWIGKWSRVLKTVDALAASLAE